MPRGSPSHNLGDKNQLQFLSSRAPAVDGPVLEVGSRDYGGAGASARFRDHYPGLVGLDVAPGQGVDVVADIAKSTDLPDGHFALVICCSVLEHVENPWAVAENITKLLKPGGSLYVSVPWTWRYHGYPDDYWRFSWSGIAKLFPAIKWGEPMFSTTREGEFFKAEFQADNNLAQVIEGRKFIPYLMLHMMGTK